MNTLDKLIIKKSEMRSRDYSVLIADPPAPGGRGERIRTPQRNRKPERHEDQGHDRELDRQYQLSCRPAGLR
jgi:hypothetical protein